MDRGNKEVPAISSGGKQAARPLLWALVTCAIAAVTGAIAYSIGTTGDGGTRAAAAPPEPTAPALLSLPTPAPARAPARDHPAEDRAYLRGRKAGKREGRRAERRALESRRRALERRFGLPGPGWYAVGVGPDGRTQPTQLAKDRRYRICQGGRGLCADP
jgi:hypothetical protein